MTDRPYIRGTSRQLRFEVKVWDYLHGERFQRDTVVYVWAEEWLNRKTGRYGRKYTAQEDGRLGAHMASTPRQAILRAVNPVVRRGGWITDACAQARKLRFR